MSRLPTENAVGALGFLLTRFCPAACDHCGSNSGPDVRGWIDPDLAGRLLTEAAMAGVDSVLFSGGEPLARFDHALDVISRAASAGLAVSVCTNAGWARDPQRAESRIEQLVEQGVGTLLLSTDRWHLPYIPLEAVIFAARAGIAAGLDVQISVPSGAGDFGAMSLASKLRSETNASVLSHPVHPVGRGEDLPPHVLGVTPPDLSGCHLVGHVEVDYDGSVSVCPTSAEFGPQSPLVLGDATTERLDILIDRFRRTPWFAIISRWGPMGAHLAAGGDVGLRDRSSQAARHPCFLCREVNTSTETARSASEALGVDLLAPASPSRFAAILAQVEDQIAEALKPVEQLVEIR